MDRREKIIVSVMAATMLLGGYLYFIPGTTDGRRGVENQPAAPNLDFTQEIIRKFKEDTSLVRDLFTIRSAERKWGKDPFLKNDASLSDTQQRKAKVEAPVPNGPRSKLNYTGFLEAGSTRLAIINGIEYEAGESINREGYYVRRIRPHQVEIGKRKAPDVIILKLADHENISGD
ncbi:MAG: hypothetical protein HGJ94_20800 [Desulfosarcina sp.]|nr:hypothetical protein [Desulfosarcina sp.]MBC2741953.1 hypothetical protein [Desulfosarcina sp.]MBC2764866.1 hypothetical protein [Desulfosarcina sp.]